jgi:hypothetical protein
MVVDESGVADCLTEVDFEVSYRGVVESHEEHWASAIHRSEDPVSRITLKG